MQRQSASATKTTQMDTENWLNWANRLNLEHLKETSACDICILMCIYIPNGKLQAHALLWLSEILLSILRDAYEGQAHYLHGFQVNKT